MYILYTYYINALSLSLYIYIYMYIIYNLSLSLSLTDPAGGMWTRQTRCDHLKQRAPLH